MSTNKNPLSRAVQRATQIFRNPPAAPVQTPGQNPGAPLPRATSFPGGYKVENARIVAIYKTFIGEFTPPTFRDAVTAFRTDGDIFNAVNFIGNAALSPGFYCTGDASYEGGDALALVEEFNRSILWGGNKFSERGLAGLMRIFSRELIYGGNTFLEMITPDALYKLQQVQIATIWKLNRDEFGNVREIWQKVGGIPYQLDPDNIIHIPFLTINREAVGVGIMEPLLEPALSANGEIIAPLWILKASVTYDIARMLHRRASPHSIFNYPNAGDEELTKYEQALINPAVDASWFTNLDPPPTILTEEAGRFQGVQALLDYFNARYQSALQTPINMLVTSSGYTEACYDSETLTLTDSGWKYFWEVGDNERIATFNPETDKLEFHVPEAKYVYDHDGAMIHFQSAKQDILVTPNHRMYYRTRNWNIARAEEVADIDQVYFRNSAEFDIDAVRKDSVTIPGQTGNGLRAQQALELNLGADSWLKLVGYYISEGATREKQHGFISITQKKEPTVSHIRKTLQELEIPFHEYFDRRFNAIEFQLKGGKRIAEALRECGTHAEAKRIPRIYLDYFSRDQLRILLEALLEGDGSKDSRPNRVTYEYFTTSERLSRDVLELALRCGYSAYIYKSQDKRTDHKRKPIYRVAIYTDSRRETKLSRGFTTVEHYTGKVYCFTVKNGLFLTMRNGKPTIQGNSARVAKELGGLIVADLQQRIKDAVENELYCRILKQNDYDPERAKIELHWGLPSQPVFTLTEISKLYDQKAISLYEYREFMRDLGLKVKDDSEFNDDMKEQSTEQAGRNEILNPNPLVTPNTVVGKPHSIPMPNNVPNQKNPQIAKKKLQERVFSVEDSSRPEINEKLPVRFEKEHIVGEQNWKERRLGK